MWQFSLQAAGKNGLEVYWWGFKIFLDSYWSERVADAITGGAAGSGLAVIISNALKVPGHPIVKAAAAIIALGGGLLAQEIRKKNKDKGVYFRFTGVGHYVFTGVHSQ